MKRPFRTFLTTLMLTASTIVGVPASASGQDDVCTPVVIMPIRGSGEKSAGEVTYDGTKYDGWEGHTLRRYLKAFYGFPESRSVPLLELGAEYPAVGVRELTEFFSPTAADSPVLTSARTGAREGVKKISALAEDQQSAGCAAPEVILIGYSQGMIVARQIAMSMQDSGLIAGVYGVGDPLQKPSGGSGVMGERSNGNGIFRLNYSGLAREWDKFYDGDWESYTLCHHLDPICGMPADVRKTEGHMDYFATARRFQAAHDFPAGENSESDAFANLMIGLVEEIRATVGDPSESSAKKDTVFLIDTTGSMGGVIHEARARAKQLSSLLVGSNSDSRVSLIEYRDLGDAFVTRTVIPFTRNVSEFHTGLDGLVAEGGGDWPEAVYSGIHAALESPFRADAVRSLVVIGDAPAHDPDLVNGWTTDIAAERLKGIGSLDVHPLAHRMARELPGDRSQALSDAAVLEPSLNRFERTAAAAQISTPVGSVERAPVTLYSLSTDITLHDQMSQLAESSGGTAFGLEGSGEVGDAIEGALVEIDKQPSATGGAEPGVVQNSPAMLSCAGSTAPDGVESIGFDLDADGVIDIPCVEGTAETRFTTPGMQRVTVIVNDTQGRTGVTTFEVDVLLQGAGALTPVEPAPEGNGSLGTVSGSLGSLTSLGRSSGSVPGSLAPLPAG